jgi:2-polyprenyl-3-methyl-5-hydroxy-6-metoxy-1,4-benzoquinol methylase
MKAGNTMERIIPDELNDAFGLASLELHYERYRFAGKNIAPGRLLDIACGTGYGAYLLANEFSKLVSEIIGVDISGESIKYADEKYAHPKIKFVQGDALNFSANEKFDSIISLETIEHLQKPSAFIEKIYPLLNKGGVWIVSAPITFSTDINPYHLHDFSEKSFRRLFSLYSLVEINSLLQTQKISFSNIINRKKSKRSDGMRQNMMAYYLFHPKAFFARAQSIFKDGFVNKYIVLVLRKND